MSGAFLMDKQQEFKCRLLTGGNEVVRGIEEWLQPTISHKTDWYDIRVSIKFLSKRPDFP